MIRIFTILFVASANAAVGYGQDAKPAEFAPLSGQLGDRDYRIREEAAKHFLAFGAEGLPMLRKVAESGNREAAERALELIAKIEKRIDNDRETAGTIVESIAKEQTLAAALDSLRKQTGYELMLVGDQKPITKKLTPKGGKADFWDVIEAIAAAADLVVESDAVRNSIRQDKAIEALAHTDSFVLRKRTKASANPVCVSGAFRIESIPGTLAFAQQFHNDRFSAILQITPEPGRRWVGTSEVLLTSARDQDGRSLSLDYLDAPPLLAAPNFGGGGAFGAGGNGNFGNNGGFGNGGFGNGGNFGFAGPVPINPYQIPVLFQSHRDGATRTLKTFDGVIRGRVWGQPEALLTIAGLSNEFREVAGENGMTMKAKIAPLSDEPTGRMLAVVVEYDSAACTPTFVSDGLTLFDGAGKPMTLIPLNVTTQPLGHSDGIRHWQIQRLTAQYALRTAKPDEKLDPQKLVFSGCRVKSVDVPFRLKDIPVIRGSAEALRVETNVHFFK